MDRIDTRSARRLFLQAHALMDREQKDIRFDVTARKHTVSVHDENAVVYRVLKKSAPNFPEAHFVTFGL